MNLFQIRKTSFLKIQMNIFTLLRQVEMISFPDTTSKSDTDSEASLKCKPTSKTKHLDVRSAIQYLTCDSTTPGDMGFETQSHTSKVRAEEPCSSEAEEPCSSGVHIEPASSQSIDTVVVGTCKKNGAKRVYDKRQHCLFCSKPYAKMARHLERAHEDKSDVARALSFRKGSKERKRQLDYIQNKGNYAHNASVMQSGKGELVPFKRPPNDSQGKAFMHCGYCQGLFLQNRVQSMCTYTGPVPSTTSEQLWGVIH